MMPISTDLLRALSQELSQIPTDPQDLDRAASQLADQLEGLAGLDELDLFDVEPATVLLPPSEAPHAA